VSITKPRAIQAIIVADSHLAFLPLGNTSIVATAAKRAAAAECSPQVLVWVGAQALDAWRATPKHLLPTCPIVVEGTLAEVALRCSAEVILIHDAQRPLTLSSTYDRVSAALNEGVVAARPSHVVVDTLKMVDANMRIVATVDRETVQSLTSPEAYLRSAITLHQPTDGWSLSVDGRRELVRGDQESLRVREPADVLLVESFLAWQTIS